MIYVNMIGRVGNQMFEYAFARALQLKTGQSIVINTKYLSKKTNYTFDLAQFCLIENVTVESNRNMFFPIDLCRKPIKIIRRLFPEPIRKLSRIYGGFFDLKTIYHKPPLKLHKKNYYINGYFQSSKYFDEFRDILYDDFTPIKGVELKNHDLFERIIGSNSVCVTIRRGDYVTNEKTRKRFYVCDEKYFKDAVERVKKEIHNPILFIFSDDIEWAKSNLSFDLPTFYESGDDTVSQKLLLMSSCKHFIISNSSFSWWAQYLSKNLNKRVYAPNKWYANGIKCSIYDNQNWIKIEV